MAKPDLDDGWIPLAHELLAAVLLSGFTKPAKAVLLDVFLQAFGPAKRRVVALSPTELGRRLGKSRQFVERGIKELLDSGAMRRVGTNQYAFNKDYDAWTFRTTKGETAGRFDSAELVAIASAPKIALAFKHETIDFASSNLMTHKRSSGIKFGYKLSSNLPTAVPKFDDKPASNLPTCTHAAGPNSLEVAYKDRAEARARDVLRREKPGEVGEGADRPPNGVIGFVPESDLADALGLGADLRRNAAMFDPKHAGSIPAEWLRPALERVRAANPDKPWAYLLGILRGFAESGGPPARPAPGGNRFAEIQRLQDEALEASAAAARLATGTDQ